MKSYTYSRCDVCHELAVLRIFRDTYCGDTDQCGECRGLTAAEQRDEIQEAIDFGDVEEPHHSIDPIAVAAQVRP